MKLQTKIPFKKAQNPIDYRSRILLLGSCFSGNMGRKLAYFRFGSLQNPFGILFHPKAIENLVERAILKNPYTETDIFFLNDRWQCFDAHSDLSDTSQEKLLRKLNDNLISTLGQLKKSTHIGITLGTAWVYRHVASEKIVANCHKVSQKEFTKELLPIEAITESLTKTISLIRSVNRKARVIFTVSPVRHLKDGFIENQQGKAHLIAAIHNVLGSPSLDKAKGAAYFPSYELMMDELRDYRFYEADMVHPNQIAIDYIWEKFEQVWISEDAFETMAEVDALQKGLRHRPFQPDSEQHLNFKKSLEKKIEDLQQRYPFMEFDRERQ